MDQGEGRLQGRASPSNVRPPQPPIITYDTNSINSYVDSQPSPLPLAERPTSAYSSSTHSITPSISHSMSSKKKGPAVAPKRGAKKVKYVEALYNYDARTSAEFSMQEGDRFVLVKADGGDGWAEVELNGVTKSVPANYVQTVD